MQNSVCEEKINKERKKDKGNCQQPKQESKDKGREEEKKEETKPDANHLQDVLSLVFLSVEGELVEDGQTCTMDQVNE